MKTPQLSFETKLGPEITPGFLYPAGLTYTVIVKVRDLSYRHSIALMPNLSFSGNAQGGQLLETDQEIPDQESGIACGPGQGIQLGPREEHTYKVAVYTSSVSALAEKVVEGAKQGGTRSVVVVKRPVAGIVNEAGDDLEKPLLAPSQIVMSGQRRYEVSLSDPASSASTSSRKVGSRHRSCTSTSRPDR